MYRIGMDGGGTRTRLAVIEQGREVFRCETGGINYNSFPEEEIRSSLQAAVAEMESKGYLLSACEGIGIGAAGVSNPEAAPFLESILRKIGFTCPVVIVGDHEAALAGAVGKQPGILLIAGTGSICIAQDGLGNQYSSGGYGHVIDDAGSAYAVGRDILTAIVQAEDGRAESTALRTPVFDFLHVEDTRELIAWLYDGARTKKDIAAVASCLTEEMIRADGPARNIACLAAANQAMLVEAVLNQLGADQDAEIPLLLEGGLILNNREVNGMFRQQLTERKLPVRLAEKQRDAAYGAASLVG